MKTNIYTIQANKHIYNSSKQTYIQFMKTNIYSTSSKQTYIQFMKTNICTIYENKHIQFKQTNIYNL